MGHLKNSVKTKKESPKTEVQVSLKEEVWNQTSSSLKLRAIQLFITSNIFINYILDLISYVQILQLEKRLQDQFEVRRTLEKALGYKTSSHDYAPEMSMPKVT